MGWKILLILLDLEEATKQKVMEVHKNPLLFFQSCLTMKLTYKL